jgi:hypothetical protein
MNSQPHLLRPILVLLASLLSTSWALANMAAPLQPGHALGEPDAALAALVIEREQLDIDLRALGSEPVIDGVENDDFGKALISAEYHIRNDSAKRALTLDFVAAAVDTAQWTVWVDGHEIRASYRESSALPASFSAPRTTPGFERDTIPYEAHATGIIRFETELTPGRHAIRVEYVAKATRHRVGHPLVHWQLAYILAPARRWPSFGGLDVTITAPPQWEVATTPALERTGDILRGHFRSIPSDALAITARGHYAWWYPLASWLPAALALLIGAIAAYRAGRGYGRRLARFGRGSGWAIPAAVGAGFVLMVAIPVAGWLGASLEESLVGAGQQPAGYGFFVEQFFRAVVAFASGVALAQAGAVVSIRRARRRYDPRWADAYDIARKHPPDVMHQNGTVNEPHH